MQKCSKVGGLMKQKKLYLKPKECVCGRSLHLLVCANQILDSGHSDKAKGGSGSRDLIKAMALVLLLLSLLILMVKIQANCSFHCEAYECPCECIKNEIRCGHRNVTWVYDFPPHTSYEMVDFGSNYIKYLKKQHFSEPHMHKVHTLQLSDNQIEEVEDFSFNALRHLSSLFLNSNRIKNVKDHTFAGLHTLKRLYLNNNQIVILRKHVFNPFKSSLKLLYLQSNQINFIEKGTLEGFSQLKTLDLSGNKLFKLDSRFLNSAHNLANIFMGGNPWRCDDVTVCLSYGEIQKTTKQKTRQRLVLHDKMICQTPERYRFKDMSIVVQIYKCDKINLKPNVTTIPPVKDDNRGNGNNVTSNSVLLSGCVVAWVIITMSIRAACS